MFNLLFVNILPGLWFKYVMSWVEYLKLPALQYAQCQCIFRPQAVLCSTIWFMGFQSETCNKFFPSLKVQTRHCIGAELPHFSNVKWLAGSPSKILRSHNFPVGRIRQKRAKGSENFSARYFLSIWYFKRRSFWPPSNCDLTSESRNLFQESNPSRALKVFVSKELLWNEPFLYFASNKVTDQEKSCSIDKKSHDRGCPSDRARDGPAEES